MMTIHLCPEREDKILTETEKVLKGGGVAIVPTDTVYGLVCDGMNEKAKERIYEVKKRGKDKLLIGFGDTIEKVKKFAEVTAEQEIILKQNWPGAKTYILKATKDVYLITASTGKIAFRIPAHNFLLSPLSS